jgi:GT2 family glycosyltransferase
MISVVIVNYNTSDILRLCIDSFYKYNNQIIFEIIIIDNASNEENRLIIQNLSEIYPNISYIQLNNKIHFSAANNIGIRKSKYDFILIMNPDIIFNESIIDILLNNFDDTTGAVSPVLIGKDGRFQRNYFQRYPSIKQFVYFHSILAKLFNKSSKKMHRYLENHDIDINSNQPYIVEQLPCAFFLTKKNILEEINFMDEKFELFFEDVDLSYRIAKNYKLKLITKAKVTHIGGSSFNMPENNDLFGIYIMSMIYFFRKHYNSKKANLLKQIVIFNSKIIIFIEYIKKIFHKENSYRIKKHNYLLNKLKQF